MATVALRKKEPNKEKRQRFYLDIYRKGQKREYIFLDLFLLDPEHEAAGLKGGEKKDRITEIKQLNLETKKTAERVRELKEHELNQSAFGVVANFKKETNFITYFESIINETPNKNRRRNLSTTLQHLLKCMPSDKIPMSQLNKKFLETFQKYLKTAKSQYNKPFEPVSQHTYFAILEYVINRAFQDELIQFNPVGQVKHVSVPDKPKLWLTWEEVQRLAATPCIHSGKEYPEVKKMHLASMLTLLDHSTSRSLKWGMIQNNEIHIKRQKTQKMQIIPINENFWEIVGAPGAPNELVFKPEVKYTQTMTVLRSWYALAGIKMIEGVRMGTHTPRRTGGTVMVNMGQSLAVVSKIYGHSNTSTTERYIQVSSSAKRAAIEVLPSIFNTPPNQSQPATSETEQTGSVDALKLTFLRDHLLRHPSIEDKCFEAGAYFIYQGGQYLHNGVWCEQFGHHYVLASIATALHLGAKQELRDIFSVEKVKAPK